MRRSPGIVLFILVFFVLCPFYLSAQRGGESLFGILHLTPSARMNALGGHQPALYDKDPSGGLFNPALADSSFHNNVSLGFSPYIADINYGYGSFAWNVPSTGTFFAGVNHLGYGDMIMADETGTITGDFTASESVVFLGFAKALSPRFSAGITVKPVFSNIESYHSWGMAVDGGIHYNHPEGRFHAAALLRNAGRQIKSYDAAPPGTLSPDLQLGFSTKLEHAPFRFSVTARDLLSGSLDFRVPENEYGINVSQPESADAGFGELLMRHFVFGVEFVPSDNFYVAGGLNPRRRHELKVDSRTSTVGYSWGFGFRVYKFNFAYSSARYHLASSANHFSITTNISDF
ncbi:MAG: type IX secretion system protein PorQ [Marinilabilia sp.]